MLEKDIEYPVVRYAEGLGVYVEKLQILRKRGWPDQTFIIPWGHIFFIEFKTPTGVLSGPQKRRIKKLRRIGYTVYVIDNIKEGEIAINKELAKVSK